MSAPTSPVSPSPNAADFADVVTPSDSANLATPTRALYVGGAGDVVVVMNAYQNAVKFASVPAGTILPVRVLRVNATNTTATLIVALW